MKKSVIAAVCLCTIVFAAIAWGAVSVPLSVTVSPKPVAGAGPCSNPVPPHPAQAVGFTKLVDCWDFTQQVSINNVVNGGAPQTTNWTSMNWLDCTLSGGSGKQWVLGVVGLGNNNPCSANSVALDSKSGLNALIQTALPAHGAGATLGISTAAPVSDNCSGVVTCYEVLPTANLYAEINWRVDPTEWSAITNRGPGYGVVSDFWSWPIFAQGGCREIDFIEYFFGSPTPFPVGTGSGQDYCSPPGTGSGRGIGGGGNPNAFNIDSNYHTTASLITSNRTSLSTGCFYLDGVGTSLDHDCNKLSGAASNAYTQPGYIVLQNGASATGVLAAPVHVWTAWIRIWSCSGWAYPNTCSVASPPTTPP